MEFPEKALQFLIKLRANNERPWFNERKKEFKSYKKLNKHFFQQVMFHLQSVDEIENMKQFRIYRDIRFSKDKTPYKRHYAARFVRKSKKRRGTYYLHIEPENNSFCAGGFYGPDRDDLVRIRKEFEIDDEPMREILSLKSVRNYFPEGIEGDELKTSPRDFSIDHPAIDLIRKKQFYLKKSFTDEQLVQNNFSQEVAQCFGAMLPFLNYMTEIVTTDLNGRPIF